MKSYSEQKAEYLKDRISGKSLNEIAQDKAGETGLHGAAKDTFITNYEWNHCVDCKGKFDDRNGCSCFYD